MVLSDFGWNWCNYSTARLAWLAAMNNALLSLFNTFSQQAR